MHLEGKPLLLPIATMVKGCAVVVLVVEAAKLIGPLA